MTAEPLAAEPRAAERITVGAITADAVGGEPDGLDEECFRASMAQVAASVSVVCTVDGAGRAHGLTVSSLCSLSLHPPLLLVCLRHGSATARVLCERDQFAVSVLGSGQEDVARRFATPSIDRFSGRFAERPTAPDGDTDDDAGAGPGAVGRDAAGLPVLAGALAWLRCRRHRVLEAGDHTILVGLVEAATTHPGGRPLLYFDRGYRALRP